MPCMEPSLQHQRRWPPSLSRSVARSRRAFECGVATPTLPGVATKSDDMLLAALFLKRCLGDLGGMWLLHTVGYTSQAATVAASAFENALTVAALLARPQDAAPRVLSDTGETPWPPFSSARFRRKWNSPLEHTNSRKRWREMYAAYKWLCRIKHPTAMSEMHDAGGSATGSGEYVVMAAPDTRKHHSAVRRSSPPGRRAAVRTTPCPMACASAARLARPRPIPFVPPTPPARRSGRPPRATRG